jgi:predicted nucleic acid-binding protein
MTVPESMDSNIVLHAYDPNDARKQKIAQQLLKKGLAGRCCVSVQLLAEVSATLLHKVTPAATNEAVEVILDLRGPIPTISPDGDTVRRAVETCSRYGVHFYDGMMLATAEQAGCTKIWPEDLKAGQVYSGIKVENPFA